MSDAGDAMFSLSVAGSTTDFLAVAFRATEEISRPFELTVDMISADGAVDPDSVLYQPLVLTVRGTRVFNGLVRSFAMSGMPERNMYLYTAVVAPKLWFMRQTVDCRIFQQAAVSDILTSLAGDVSQTLSVKATGAATTAQEYVTQYNETDFDFVQRLLEESGAYYYFEHTSGDHTMVVCDSNQDFATGTTPAFKVAYEGGGPDVLMSWRKLRATALGSMALNDYDPTAPSPLPSGSAATTLDTGGTATRDGFNFPARRFASGDAKVRAGFIMDAAEAAVTLYEATGVNHDMCAGATFTIASGTTAESGEYVVQRIVHTGFDDSWKTNPGPQPAGYHNAFVAFPEATPWRQPISSPRPVLGGVYGAIVLGSGDEEIHADQYGRIKVQLFFDRRQQTSADQGVWARVIQPWAGNTWGWQHLPRVGTEVAVAFMDGDPDRPIVVGGVYNANMMPVFPIPSQQNKSGWRTRSTTGGSTSTFSELSVDDTAGSELFYMHAEKDMTVEVENNRTTTVTQNESLTVSQGAMTTTVSQGDMSETVTQGKKSITVSTGDFETTVSTGDHKITVSTGDQTVTISVGDHSLECSLGNISMKADLGSVTIEAMQGITLKCMDNSVQISPQGVTIDGMMVTVGSGSTLQNQSQGLMVQTSGSGMAQHSGSIMMINS